MHSVVDFRAEQRTEYLWTFSLHGLYTSIIETYQRAVGVGEDGEEDR